MPTSATTIVDDPSLLVVCPQPGWKPEGPAMASGVQLSAGMPEFDRLVDALSAPDESAPMDGGGVCPMYADVAMYVYAENDVGKYRLAIPVDACGHFQSDAMKVIEPLTQVVR